MPEAHPAFFQRIISFIFQRLQASRRAYWRFFKIQTHGVRVMLLRNRADGATEIFLVQHRYNYLWVLPGGRSMFGEDFAATAVRETLEETGHEVAEIKHFLGTYHNVVKGKDDVVTVLVAYAGATSSKKPSIWQHLARSIEVRQSGWFALGALPEPLSEATRARLVEYSADPHSSRVGNWTSVCPPAPAVR